MELINIWNENKLVITEGENFTPYITFHKAKKSINKCILIIPGGGYFTVCDDYEGTYIADYYNEFGVDAFVLRYRVNMKDLYPKPFLDAIRAMRYIRANAKKFNINPNCLGIMGFSAGGHLAAWVSNCYNDELGEDDLCEYSARPDFSVLCYAVLDLYKITPYDITGLYLLGEEASEEKKECLCMQNCVSINTPPTFLFHTYEDQVVPVMNSVKYYEAMINNNVSGEIHIYKPGPHGMGLSTENYPHVPADAREYCSKWSEQLKNWVVNIIE